jgi:hypothetical protein
MKNDIIESGILRIIMHVFSLYLATMEIPIIFKGLIINLSNVSSTSESRMYVMFIVFAWMILVVAGELLWFICTVSRKSACRRWKEFSNRVSIGE